jgi:hypothetical protein
MIPALRPLEVVKHNLAWSTENRSGKVHKPHRHRRRTTSEARRPVKIVPIAEVAQATIKKRQAKLVQQQRQNWWTGFDVGL